MGEQKRKKSAASTAKPQHADVFDVHGKVDTPRYGGNVSEYYWSLLKGNPDKVHCDGCTVCCYHKIVDVFPDKELPENLAHLDTIQDPDGPGLILKKRADGACIHLGDGGCKVYEHRPLACRKYDCRIYSLCGISSQFDNGRITPTWVFSAATDEDLAIHISLMVGAQKRLHEDGGDAENATVYAFQHINEYLDEARALINSRKEQLA